MRKELKRMIATAMKDNEYLLPFGDDMNWQMKEDFDYI
jgi:hypothetical protein